MKKIQLLKLFFICLLLSAPLNNLYAQSKLWGMTSGGDYQFGTIFSMVPGATSVTDQFNLNGIHTGTSPEYTKLIQASDGKLYGMTLRGGAYDYGVIFQYDPATNTCLDKFTFSYPLGIYPYGSLIQASDGKFYGMTSSGGANDRGVIFQYDPVTNSYAVKIDLTYSTGVNPQGSLLQASDGKLYGMTASGGAYNGGVIFQYDPVTNSYVVLVDLDYLNGYVPSGSLIQTNDGMLYGMTQYGGANDAGVIFKYDPVANVYTDKIDLDFSTGAFPLGSLLLASDSMLYGLTGDGGSNYAGVIFKYDPATNTYTDKIHLIPVEGATPLGDLIQASDGNLYGLTFRGGVNDNGVIFKYDPLANTYSDMIDLVLLSGKGPMGSLMQAGDGKLYGMTYQGGLNDEGVIFQYDPVSNSYTDKIDLYHSIGFAPSGSLLQASDGKLYGMTRGGGALGGGVIFQFDPVTNIYIDKFSMRYETGNGPTASLIQANDGKLYGMTPFGGLHEGGVIFQYDPSTNNYIDKVDLSYSGGQYPYGSLVQANDGKLYGMTTGGGAYNDGVIFQYDPLTNSYIDKIDLINSTGASPQGALIQASDGKLYGVAPNGGANYSGVIFQYDPVTNTYTDIYDFDYSSGSYPCSALIQASDGKLYGVADIGGVNYSGVIFQYDPVTNIYADKFDFDISNGSYPIGSLFQASDGMMYGMTSGGGDYDMGVVYQYDPATEILTKKLDFNSTNGAAPVWNSFIEVFSISITTGTISPDVYCAGAEVSVTYSVSSAVNAGNTFTAQLSNAIGSFASPVNIGTLSSTTSGTISATIPSNTASGSGYRIRVISSSPVLIGSDNGSDITINGAPTSTESATACDSLVWNGTAYKTSGNYTVYFTTGAGCDSTATLNLTINNSNTSSTDVTACDSLLWNGTTYKTSGSYTVHLTNAAGCDSAATLNLTINLSSKSDTTVTACNNYLWNGTTYTSSGTYTYLLIGGNAKGCDSLAKLNLTITSCGETGNIFLNGTCSSYKEGTARTLSQICYTVDKRGKVSNTQQGVFFYLDSVTAPSASFCIEVVQTRNCSEMNFFGVNQNSQAFLYNINCKQVSAKPVITTTSSQHITKLCVTGATVGAKYIVYIKYDSKTIVGTVGNGNCNYRFYARLAGSSSPLPNSTSSLMLNKGCSLREEAIDPNYTAGNLTAYPNPASSIINVKFISDNTDSYQLQMIDLIGEVVMSKQIQPQQGENVVELNVSNLSKGIYVLTLKSANSDSMVRVVIQ